MDHTKFISDKKFVLLSLGKDKQLPSLQVIESIEKWIVRAYDGNKLRQTVDTIPKLRWYLLSKFQSDISKLPHSFYGIGTL